MLPRALCCAMLGGALLIGCEKKEETAPTPPSALPKPTAVDQAAGDAGAAVDKAASDAGAASDAAASDAAGAADAAATDATAQASQLIDQATQYIKDNKWDLAESTVKQLEGMKSSLPADYQGQVDNVRKMLDTAKAAAGTGIKLPG